MKKPLSVQLYSLREEAKEDFVGVLKKVADIGYKGVEPAGLHGLSPQEFVKIVEDLGMVVSSNHGPWPNRENVNELIDTVKALGLDIAVGGYGPDDFKDMDAIKRTAETTNFIIEKLEAAGLRLALHNHFWEFEMIDGRLAYDIFMEMCPKALCELDTYWVANFGAVDPVEVVSRYKARTPYLHIKDGPLTCREDPMVAVGQGKMDFHKVIPAADENVLRWLIVELDRCATDMTTAVAESYAYLIGEGLAEGNK